MPGTMKAILIVAIIHAICSWNHALAELTEEKFIGGGKCESDLDCNKGRCVNKDEKDTKPSEEEEVNAECFCETGNTGKYCEKEDKTSNRREKISDLRKKHQAAEKRQLQFDPVVKASGVKPDEVEKAAQSVGFYHSRTEKYVEVSKDTPLLVKITKEGESKVLQLKKGYTDGMKLFRLEKTGSEDTYYIAARDIGDTKNVGYLYLSDLTKGLLNPSNRIMMSKEKKDNVKYKFTFYRSNEQRGVYRMTCDDKTVYGSAGDFLVKADERSERRTTNEAWFQLNILPIAKLNREDIDADDGKREVDFFKNTDDFVVSSSYQDNTADTDVTDKEDTHETIANSVKNFKKIAATGNAGYSGFGGKIVLSVTGEKSKTSEDTTTTTKNKNYEIIVPKKSRNCKQISVRQKVRWDQVELKINVKGKMFDGCKLEQQASIGDVHISIRTIGLNENC